MTTATPAISVILADDHAMLREGLRGILQQHNIEVIAEAGDGQTAMELTQTHQPDVLLLDINMPIMNGLQTAQRLKKMNLPTKVVILTMSDDDNDLRAAMAADVAGYISKTAHPAMLENTLRLVADGDTVFPQRAMAYKKSLPTSTTTLGNLTLREQEILLCVARGLANKNIARELALAEGTVKVHIKAILRKLNLANRTQAAVYVLEKTSLASTQPHDTL